MMSYNEENEIECRTSALYNGEMNFCIVREFIQIRPRTSRLMKWDPRNRTNSIVRLPFEYTNEEYLILGKKSLTLIEFNQNGREKYENN